MTDTAPTDVSADQALKAKHRAMWASGDYPAIATEVVAPLGPVLAEACGITSGQRVLDVGAGTGNAAIAAALQGARVVASDLTPELFDAGRAAAEAQGATLEWQQADAEALPFGDAEFDVVMSCIGVMFAPHHHQAADELVRVAKPGATLGLLSWTPEGFIGQMFATMKPYAPPPPPGAQPPPLWGDEEHVQELLGHRVTDVRTERRALTVDRFGSGEEFRDFFKAVYGPTIAVYNFLAAEPERQAALDRDLAELGERYDQGGGVMDWEYLLLTARTV
ncbi:SAM-dependent methyltransferase [Nocardioides gansuensis]|uniref:SAM-dependent methyltransferase n=1 Tax=Nocardioides gansuensis TaxID=2138300 RepID=A0A2T8FC18_9ACTN|nr:class I SAM-dependent methyltransferase [Nocardioides gansuensis]PVG83251.1 SAM-dependent methyltransferase [Nocardioides gansuensis]